MTPHEAAVDYARHGWRVVPILPNTKRPSLTRWTEQATTNPDTINGWWNDNPDHGVGIATGPTSGIFVVDVDDLDALHDLQQQHGHLPDTLTSLTGSGGMHLIYRHPPGTEIRNDAGRRLGPGIDIRGDGGQIVAPPTIHPNGTPYTWDAGQPTEPADPPDWLIQLVAGPPTPEPATNERIANTRSDRPGDLFAAATTWADLLTADGWTLHHIDRDGEQHWTRPGKNPREGTSATTGYKGSDVLKVFTSSVQHLGLDEGDTYTKLGYLAATRFNGNHNAAASFLATQGWTQPTPEFADLIETAVITGTPPAAVAELVTETIDALANPPAETNTGWVFTDLTEYINGEHTPAHPDMLACTDGVTHLLYSGKVHSIAGEPGGGKTWVALTAIAEVLRNGDQAVLIDYEDTPATATTRLKQLGVTNQQLLRFHYINPPEAIQDRNGRMEASTIATLNWLADNKPALIVIDSVGESIATEGQDQNSDGEVATWNQLIPRRLAGYGSTILLLDHVTKNKETRGQFAVGSHRKLAAIDGAHYMLEVRTSPSKTADGVLRLVCGKDRHGTFQKNHAVCDVHVVNQPGNRVAVTFVPYQAAEFKPTRYMELVSKHLELYGDSSKTEVERDVEGKAEYIRQAVAVLVEDGCVEVYKERNAHMIRLLIPYRAPAATLSDYTGSDITQPPDTTESDWELEPDTTESGDEIHPISSHPNSPENTISSPSSPLRPLPRPAPRDEQSTSRPLSPSPIGGERDETRASLDNPAGFLA
jgi:hypothetical protein